MQMVAMYCPCYGCDPTTTYQQQVWALTKQGWDVCPCQAVLDDLAITISQWNEKGDEIIVIQTSATMSSRQNLFSFLRILVYCLSTSQCMDNWLHLPIKEVNDPIDGIHAPLWLKWQNAASLHLGMASQAIIKDYGSISPSR